MQQEVGRVLVAMSGGVDSSVAAALLQEQGYELVGVTLHLWDARGADQVGRCCSPEDRDDARLSCEHLGIPHYVFDERELFERSVVEPFVDAYRSGRTPSPCVECNRHVKLGRLLAIADELGASHVATGHYARIVHEGESSRLFRGRDRRKDQSYFLHGVRHDVRSRLLLPLGEMEKDQTRKEGQRLGVPNWGKKDSQELCFVPDGNIAGFLERRGGQGDKGAFVDEEGRVLGQHEGHAAFTVGQRKGLGLGGGHAPRYVLKVIPERAEVVVGAEESLRGDEVRVGNVRWVNEPPAADFEAEVQVRYRHEAAPANVRRRGDAFVAEFEEPQRAITPGQVAVVYQGEEVLGGGVIERNDSP